MNLELRSQLNDEAVILYCNGQLTGGAPGQKFRAGVADWLRKRRKVIVDLSQINYMDSSGLGILVGLYSSARTARSELKYVNLHTRVDYSRAPGDADSLLPFKKASNE